MVTIVEDHSKKIPAVTSLYIKLDTYEDFWTYLNELYQFNSVTEIRVFIKGKEDNYWDYIG